MSNQNQSIISQILFGKSASSDEWEALKKAEAEQDKLEQNLLLEKAKIESAKRNLEREREMFLDEKVEYATHKKEALGKKIDEKKQKEIEFDTKSSNSEEYNDEIVKSKLIEVAEYENMLETRLKSTVLISTEYDGDDKEFEETKSKLEIKKRAFDDKKEKFKKELPSLQRKIDDLDEKIAILEAKLVY